MKKKSPSKDLQSFTKLMRFESLAYQYAWHGYRGSQILWSFCNKFLGGSRYFPSQVLLLPSGFIIRYQAKDWTKRTIYQGTYERALLHFLNSLKLNDLVIDVGANIGVTLWHSLKNSGSKATYLAFEPSIQCISDLEFTGNQISNTGKIFKYALGESDTTQRLYGVNNEKHSGLASLIKSDSQVGDSHIVQVRKLDTVLDGEGLRGKISLLKIDTEGYEGSILSGAHKLLKSRKVEILILEVSPHLSELTYLENLYEILGDAYIWFMIEEVGVFHRQPKLRKISHTEATTSNFQFNLAIVRSDRVEVYVRDTFLA